MKAGKPYTDAGLAKQTCCACQKAKATEQWSVTVCATGRKRLWVPVCLACDIEFNDHTLGFINHPDREALMARYREEKNAASLED